MERLLGEDVGEPAPPQKPRVGVCNRKGIVLDFHVWDEPRLVCTRCGFTKATA